ncbi:hypothetical protein P7K49_024855 [Saguinus oedipus]|uniref:Uncharacterized protein n=1 Tax=Saguinus oedipus TaxID=9490 RepID=A0ABQ9UFN6_SAGOE|nr:hypothetical protein P7K49_024855 [Saguinus oedipus]
MDRGAEPGEADQEKEAVELRDTVTSKREAGTAKESMWVCTRFSGKGNTAEEISTKAEACDKTKNYDPSGIHRKETGFGKRRFKHHVTTFHRPNLREIQNASKSVFGTGSEIGRNCRPGVREKDFARVWMRSATGCYSKKDFPLPSSVDTVKGLLSLKPIHGTGEPAP